MIKEKDSIIGGPIYLGELHNPEIIKRMLTLASERNDYIGDKAMKIISLMLNEKGLLYYDLHYIGRMLNSSVPKTSHMIEKLKELGYYAAPTHFTSTGIRTDAPSSELIKIFRSEVKKEG